MHLTQKRDFQTAKVQKNIDLHNDMLYFLHFFYKKVYAFAHVLFFLYLCALIVYYGELYRISKEVSSNDL